MSASASIFFPRNGGDNNELRYRKTDGDDYEPDTLSGLQ